MELCIFPLSATRRKGSNIQLILHKQYMFCCYVNQLNCWLVRTVGSQESESLSTVCTAFHRNGILIIHMNLVVVEIVTPNFLVYVTCPFDHFHLPYGINYHQSSSLSQVCSPSSSLWMTTSHPGEKKDRTSTALGGNLCGHRSRSRL